MAKYTIIHSCGHESIVRLTGRTRDREWQIERMEGRLCEECWHAEQARKRAEENAAAATANAEAGLPALVGSEKQVAWAETIRAQKLATLDIEMDTNQAGIASDTEANQARLRAAVSAIRNQDQARWWIDHRDERIRTILRDTVEHTDVPLPDDQVQLAAAAEAEAIIKATVRPENPVTETVAEIRILADSVEVMFPERHEGFRQLVRYTLGYSWTETRWRRKLSTTNGTPEDRACELGNRLLGAGFIIRLFDEDLRGRAISGAFEPECRLWIYRRTTGKYTGWFAILWPRDGRNYYDAARKLPGSRYDKPFVVVPAAQFEQVLDFAEMFQFRLTEAAERIAEQARQTKQAALVAQPAEPGESPAGQAPSRKPQPLAVPENVGVADEFRE